MTANNTAANIRKALNTKSKAIATTARALGKEIQDHLIDIAQFVASEAANGDVSTAVNFVNALSEFKDGESHSVVRVQAVKAWLSVFAPVKFSTGDDGNVKGKLNKTLLAAIHDDADHFKVARRTYWNRMSPEKDEPIFDFEKAIVSLAKRADEKLSAKTTAEGKAHKVTAEQFAAIRDLATSMGLTV